MNDDRPLWVSKSFWLLVIMFSVWAYGIFWNPTYRLPSHQGWLKDVRTCELARADDIKRFKRAIDGGAGRPDDQSFDVIDVQRPPRKGA